MSEHVSLIVHVQEPYQEVHILDEQGHFVQEGLGGVRTRLLPGRYYANIRGVSYPIDLKEPVVFEEPETKRPKSAPDPLNIDKEPIVLDCFISRRICPICEDGVLLGRRDNETLEMLKTDNCILCGQRFVYKDLGIYAMFEKGEKDGG